MIHPEGGLAKIDVFSISAIAHFVYGGIKCILDIREGKEHISVHIKSKSGMHAFKLLMVYLKSVEQ